MTFDPSLGSVRDRLRLQLGDTVGDPGAEFFLDETYDATLAYYGNNETRTLVALAEALIAKFAQSASRIDLGDMRFVWRDRMTGWQGIVTRFAGVAVAAGGGGFVIMSPTRRGDECLVEYQRAYIPEPWFNDWASRDYEALNMPLDIYNPRWWTDDPP